MSASTPRAIWALILATAAGAGLLALGPLQDVDSTTTDLVPWWTMIVAFALTEVTNLRLHLRHGTHEFNLSEAALVLGAFLFPPLWVLAAFALGTVPVRLLRRTSLVKQAFNLAVGALEVTLALTLILRSVDVRNEFGPTAWLVTLLSVLLASLASTVAVTAAITLSGGRLDLREIRDTFLPASTITVSNASLALAGVAFVQREDGAAVLLLLPLLVLFFGYRSLVGERLARGRTEFLARVTRRVQEAGSVERAVPTLLAEVRDGLSGEVAELVLFGRSRRRVRYDTTGLRPAVHVARSELVAVETALADRPMGFTVESGACTDDLQEFLDDRGLRNAVVSPMTHDERTIAVLVVGNRHSDVHPFGETDLVTLATLAAQTGAVLRSDELSRAMAQLEELQDELTYQARHDHLTGLPNRREFTEQVERVMASSRPDAAMAAVLFIDLDDFKTINDSLGHLAGDELLIQVATNLRRAVRPQDTPARLGGDEFAVLIEGITMSEEAVLVAHRIIDAFGERMEVAGKPCRTSASIGVAYGVPGLNDPGVMLSNADIAMYAAKANGKCRVEVFESGMQSMLDGRLELKVDLAQALDDRQLTVEYQPIVDIGSGHIERVEALARWHHPTRGPVSPSEFVPLAESSGFIGRLGRFVLETACNDAALWRDGFGPDAPGVAVNVSALELGTSEFVADVRAILELTGLQPERLTIEIVERVFLHNDAEVVQRLCDLQDLGVRIALDDFGTGYSSLGYLRWLPVDELKIDQSFTRGVTRAGPDRAVVETVLTLGSSLGIEVIAEGIENIAQMTVLQDLDCRLGQGYVTGRPMTSAILAQRLDEDLPEVVADTA